MAQGAFGALKSLLEPAFLRPDYLQTAALCLREGESGPEVLLISSLGTRRWILPKGWPMPGRTLAEAALQEAWEEAGVIGTVREPAIGSFGYRKVLKGGLPVPCRCEVFRVDVEKLARDYPEKGRRRRKWVSAQKAATMVKEPELREILNGL